ncbi:MAG: cytochrome c3 family protein [Stellaceae bacterium]
MQAEVTFLTQRGAAVMRKSDLVTGQSIRFGRGTGNEVQLADIRVELAAAALSQRTDGLYIERLGDGLLRVNGGSTAAARVGPGDEILIGPYKIVLSAPPEGLDAALSVELVQPPGDALRRLTTESRVRLDQTRVNKRVISWAAFVSLTLLCLAIPIAIYSVGFATKSSTSTPANHESRLLNIAWSPGEMSNPHRYFAQRCATCHESAFAPVSDSACLKCHSAVGNHFQSANANDLGQLNQSLQRTRCADCHEEHRGLRSLVIREGALCVGCHRSLGETLPNSGLRDVRGFPDGHPQFRVTVVADAAARSFTRVDLDAQPKPVDHPNLTFSHAAHLVPEGYPTLGYKPMVCADCHVPEPSSQGFLPITFKGQCQHCHARKFDAALPWKEVPHGDDERVRAEVEGFYASAALAEGGPQRTGTGYERQLPNDSLAPPSTAPGRRAWVREKTAEALGIIFDPKRGCFYCHTPDHARGEFRVAPVLMRARFLEPALFDHAKHRPVECSECHPARQSQSSADLLIPGIGRCITCHGSEGASYKAQSTCTSCHVFHRQELGPMHPTREVEK